MKKTENKSKKETTRHKVRRPSATRAPKRYSKQVTGTSAIKGDSILMDSQHPHGILSIIKEHHDGIRPDIETIKSERTSVAERRAALKHFLLNLKIHAHAEEKVLYSACEVLKPLKQMTREGYIEHETAERLMRELEVSGFETTWSDEIAAKAKVLVELVEHHIREEENEMFEKIRGSFTRLELNTMADAYLIAYEYEKVKAEGMGMRIPSLEEMKETVNKSWKEVYAKVSDKLNDYVKPARK